MKRSPLEFLHRAFHRPETSAYRWVQGVVWTLIALSITLFLVEMQLPELPAGHPDAWQGQLLTWVDNLLLLVFAAELGMRVLSFRPRELELFGDHPALRLRATVVGRLCRGI